MNIEWIESWSKRKGLGANSVRKYKDWKTKYVSPKVRSLARPCHPPELCEAMVDMFDVHAQFNGGEPQRLKVRCLGVTLRGLKDQLNEFNQ
ncbi:hypothetical protein MTR_4g012720 [Medicago truncatula]|uniref:Uncharacterized protein n=1 Tax=Medicago truncatula TaxID=3880 RepID=G7JJC5_MEDTR|nr:hypothetical protein MTR_4g012720 [Medicago truncatula]